MKCENGYKHYQGEFCLTSVFPIWTFRESIRLQINSRKKAQKGTKGSVKEKDDIFALVDLIRETSFALD